MAYQANKNAAHPNERIVLVRNKGSEKLAWNADGKPCVLEAGEVAEMPLWVFYLGMSFPSNRSSLEQMEGREGTEAYEAHQKALLAQEIEAGEQALKELQSRVKDLKRARASKAGAEDPLEGIVIASPSSKGK